MTTRKYSSRSQQTTLTGAVTSGATSITVVSGTALLGGVTIPAGTTFTLVLDPDTAIEEIVDATAVSTNTFTITRAIDGSSAQDHSAGAVVRHMAIGRDYRDANLHAEASAYYNDGSGSGHTMHGIGSGEGDVVGTLKTQTLTNKTLTAPTISDPTITGTASAGAVLVFEGTTADAYETTLTVVDPTQDNTVTIPNTTGTVVIATATQTLTNKTLTSPVISGSPVITGLSSAGMVASSATPKDYVDSILGSATAAATSAASAATSAASAATSATSAANSATASAASAATAATSATAAATSATSAAASATAAATSATSSAASATTAQAWAIQLVTPVSGSDYSAKYNANLAATSASSASTSASSAATSASSAATSATNAANSATASASSASAAATSATSAAASATAAATSATSAAASATAAATSATSAAASATAAAGYVVPTQTGNAGKFLATDGTAVSWSNSATSFVPTGSTVPTNGVYLPAANTLGLATNSTERMRIDSSGQVGIGVTPTAGRTLEVRKSLTGGTSATAVFAGGTIQSDVTSQANMFTTFPATQAAAFALTNLVHYNTAVSSIGAGSSIGTQIGFNVGNLTQASTNIAFKGATASAANAWNFYADGTAANYFAGRVGIGATLTSGAMAQVVNTTAADIGFIIKGAASQTGDLLQVQNSAATELFTIDSAGNVGINTATPATRLHITGLFGLESNSQTIPTAATITGVPNFVVGGNYSNGSGETNLWNAASNLPGGIRLSQVTGTGTYNDMAWFKKDQAQIFTSNVERFKIDSGGSTFTTGGLFVGNGVGASGPSYIEIGSSRTADGSAYIDLVSDTTYTDYGLRIIKGGGANGSATINSRGTGGLAIAVNEAGPITLSTNNTVRVNIDSSGNTTINAVADATTTTAARGGGYMGIPQSAAAGSGAYTVVAADAGEHIYTTTTRTVTIPANASVAFPVGTVLSFISGVGATTTIAITSDTMYLAGAGTTGSRTLAAHGMATAVKVASTTWYISGNGLT